VLTEESSWFYRARDGEQESGVQIDMLIDRRDRVVNICEIKYSMDEYVIDSNYNANLRRKIETFKRKNMCKKTLQLTMITTYGVHRNMYSNMVQSQVLLEDLFHD
jgi:hypothetical protein